MKLLVDTHIFLWILSEPRRFSSKARAFLENTISNQFFLSDVSAWEASIKFGLGKLKLPEEPELFFSDRVRHAGYFHLRIDLSHVTRVHSLPHVHGDPFDRLLISQATAEDLTIISDDPVFERYSVDTLTLRDIS
ncbi:MAG: PIN domain nuclease [Acidobacteria bacterium]|nr:MAG: PIN domain nuclease [Acidobacteriota bacterium]